ncbi:MAG: hypothetical protein NXY57DRAFT_998012 [Lentinula lateritia]|nr:MAG: hypothetical protein NXY57DRAFT_998012 [Lentinula lateritia]
MQEKRRLPLHRPAAILVVFRNPVAVLLKHDYARIHISLWVLFTCSTKFYLIAIASIITRRASRSCIPSYHTQGIYLDDVPFSHIAVHTAALYHS